MNWFAIVVLQQRVLPGFSPIIFLLPTPPILYWTVCNLQASQQARHIWARMLRRLIFHDMTNDTDMVLQIAFDGEGKPTKALQGYCSKNGVQADQVTREADSKGTEYVWAEKQIPGKSSCEVNVFLMCVNSSLADAFELEA